MPFVTIRITADGNTEEQKERVIQGVTDVLVDVLGKKPEHTMVVIEEIPIGNWGLAGQSVKTIRAQAKK